MQNQLTNQTPLFVFIPVPYEVLMDSDLEINKPIQYYAEDGRIIVEQLHREDTDIICCEDCEKCPISQLYCTGECDGCPCDENCRESEEY